MKSIDQVTFGASGTASASWLNIVERFFAEITSKRIRRGSYTSVDDLETAIYDYLAKHNTKPKPFDVAPWI